MNPETRADTLLRQMREQHHPHCLLQNPSILPGFDLHFAPSTSSGVTASFVCPAELQGYSGLTHGGILSLILDAAMTNCLFARGIAAVTAELRIRYREPVVTGHAARVHAKIDECLGSLYSVSAQIIQGDVPRVRGYGKFMAGGAAKVRC